MLKVTTKNGSVCEFTVENGKLIFSKGNGALKGTVESMEIGKNLRVKFHKLFPEGGDLREYISTDIVNIEEC